MNTIQMKEILKGKKAGKIQKVGIMQVIPIFHQTSDLADYSIATPNQAIKAKTTNYGSFAFRNEDRERVSIIPSHYSVMTKKKAQDHAMSRAGLLGPKSKKTFNDAFCIQETQCGYMEEDNHEFVVLPYTLRNTVNKMGRGEGFSRLWNDISRFNREMGVSKSGGHLVYFFEKYNDKLGEFVAQFECLPKQTGAIVLIDNHVVGLEIAPNPEYWAEVWEPLIRACYGSETVRRLLTKKADEKDHKVSDSAITQATSITQLEDAVYRFEENERSKAQGIVKNVMEQKLSFSPYSDNVVGKYICSDATNGTYAGQVVMNDGYVVYASLVANATRALKKTDFAF